VISIREGKGRVDRQVMLPESYRALFAQLKKIYPREAYLFPSESNRRNRSRESRYLSPRTIQRTMKATLALAVIYKPATPNSLRHSLATHSFTSDYEAELSPSWSAPGKQGQTWGVKKIALTNTERQKERTLA
jgi:integrase